MASRSLQLAGTGRRAAIAILLAGLAGCAQPAPRTPTFSPTLPSRVLVRSAGRVVAVPLEDYVLASALSEVTPVNESPATVARIYEVQAVLARTYATFSVGRHDADGFDLCDSTHCQLYQPERIRTSQFAAAARDAVRRTAGDVLTYGNRPIEALFHSDCGGYLAAADAVWGGTAVPYLVAKPDDVPPLTHHQWRFGVLVDRLRAALNNNARSQVGRRLDAVEVKARDLSGRAMRVAIRGEQSPEIRGEDLRAVVDQAFGDAAIQSTRFTVTRTASSYVFEGSGFGHGVGLCQAGALARARRGESLDRILDSYFSGARLARLPTR